LCAGERPRLTRVLGMGCDKLQAVGKQLIGIDERSRDRSSISSFAIKESIDPSQSSKRTCSQVRALLFVMSSSGGRTAEDLRTFHAHATTTTTTRVKSGGLFPGYVVTVAGKFARLSENARCFARSLLHASCMTP
jgi:hypothetical protein